MRTLRPKNYLLLLSVCIVAIGVLGASSFAYPTDIQNPFATPIVCMKRLPDGAEVCVHRKPVTCVHSETIYIEEPDRSAGIRVENNGHYPPVGLIPGRGVSFPGRMGTLNGVRIIYALSDFEVDTTQNAPIGPLAMSSPAIMGWPISYMEPDGERITGLMPYGLLVRVWGRVVAKGLLDDDGSAYLYLDDGWGKKDGTYPDYRGLRVYCERTPPAGENFDTALGVCTTISYDPTPEGIEGDEFIVPVVRTDSENDLYYPSSPAVPREVGVASGRVRLVGQASPGVPVRVYTENESVILEDVTDQWTPFTFHRVTEDGLKVAASAAGYVSDTRDIEMGQTDADLELTASDTWVEIDSDKSSIRYCHNETATITVLVRDCEGKMLSDRWIRLTATLGMFVASGENQAILKTDEHGIVTTLFTSAFDEVGVSTISADTFPTPSNSSQIDIIITDPVITVSADTVYLTQPGTSSITAHLSEGGEPIPNSPVTFRTDFGVFQGNGSNLYETMTNANGDALAVLVISGPGAARVAATHSNECEHMAVGWAFVAYKSYPWYSAAVEESNPAVEQMDNNEDGKKEVLLVTSAGNLVELDAQGQVLWTKYMHQGGNTVALAPMDAARTNLPCVFLGAESQQKMYGFSHTGSPLAGWPTGSDFTFDKVAPVIVDVNRDGSSEIVAGDECCYVFSWNPTGDWKGTGTSDSSFLWLNLTGSPNTSISGSTCAIGDLGAPEGVLDVMVGCTRAQMYGFQGDLWGDFVTNPVYLPDWPKGINNCAKSSPAVGDIDGDGKDDLAVADSDNTENAGNIWIWLSGDDSWTGYPTGGPVESSPALCDLNDDGKLDVIVGSNSGKLFAIDWLGRALPGWSGGITLNTSDYYPIKSSPVVGDVNGDGKVEVVVGCSDGNVYALYKDGRDHAEGGIPIGPIAWVRCCMPPTETSAEVVSTPVIDDLDNDGLVDVVVGGSKGIYVFHLNAAYGQDPSLYPWPTFHHDNARTGNAGVLPAPNKASIQGIVTKDGQPVRQAEVYVYYNDDSPVYEPYSNPLVERSFVYTVGSTDPDEVGKGAYCISQLEPNSTYKLDIVIAGQHYPFPNIAVGTGMTRVDVNL